MQLCLSILLFHNLAFGNHFLLTVILNSFQDHFIKINAAAKLMGINYG